MSGLPNSSLNGSASNLSDNTGRSFPSTFPPQSGAASPLYHHSGSIQGLHNIHGSFNLPNMHSTLGSRNTAINNVPSSGVQQSGNNLSGGRFSSNNLAPALSQISQGNSHGHSGMTSRGGMGVVGNAGYSNNASGVGGSIPGILSTSAGIGNRSSVPGLGVSQILGNAGPRMTNSVGNIVGGGNIGRSISSGAGLSVPGLASRLNMNANAGSGNLNVQGPNRMMSGVLQQASPQVLSMLGNSYPSGGPLSQNHVQAMGHLNSLGLLNDVNTNDGSPFDINDFPQLSSRPSSAGGPQGQLGSLRKQGISPIVQQNQEFSIQNEDFPALPGFKGNFLAIMETILALLDDLSRDLARANADLEKFDSDVVTMSERLDQMESRRNSRAFTPETLLPMTNPPRPPHNATSQAPNSLQNREQDGPLPPQVDQVQQGGLGSQFPPIQAPQPKLHITKSSLSTESSLSQNRYIQEEEHGRERHEGYGVYDDAYMVEGDLSRMRLKANLKRERKPRVKMKMLDPRLFVIMLSGLASLWTIFVHLLWAVFSSFFDTSLVIIELSSSSCFADCFEWFLLKWPIERDEVVNLWANYSQDGEDDIRIITDMDL